MREDQAIFNFDVSGEGEGLHWKVLEESGHSCRGDGHSVVGRWRLWWRLRRVIYAERFDDSDDVASRTELSVTGGKLASIIGTARGAGCLLTSLETAFEAP